MVYVINGEHLTRRKLITIDGSKVTTETAIPLGLNINLPSVKSAGADVRLAELDGTPIAREIECKNVPNTDDIMIWYPFNTVAGQNNQFWIYWGNPNLTEPPKDDTYGREAVWNSNHAGVWHMNNDPSGGAPQLIDSTFNNNNGTSYGTMTSGDLIDGNYNKGMDFDGSNDYFNIPDITSIEGISKMSVLVVCDVRTLSASSYKHLVGSASSDTLRWGIDLYKNVNYYGLMGNGANDGIYGGPPATGLQILHMRFDGTKSLGAERLDIYKDGVSRYTGNFGIATTTANTGYVGIGYYQNKEYFNGKIYEVRILTSANSDNYITTTYNNLNNPTSAGASPFYLSFGLTQHQQRVPQFIN